MGIRSQVTGIERWDRPPVPRCKPEPEPARVGLSVRPTQDQAQAMRLMALAVPFMVDGCSLAEAVEGCALFDVLDGPAVVGAFAMRIDVTERGLQMRVTAAGGVAPAGVARAIAQWAEGEARTRVGATRLTCETKRPGLIRSLKREGFKVAGYILEKAL